jgi:hypothetical protein
MGARSTVEALAEGIVRIAVARMTSAIREISIQRGHDPRDFTLVAFGGAGPMHALALADEIGIPRVLVPRHPGNFSALGLLASDIKHDDVRTRWAHSRARGRARTALRGDGEPRRRASSSWRASPRRAAPAPIARSALSRPGVRAERSRWRATGTRSPRSRRDVPPRSTGDVRPRRSGAAIELVNARLTRLRRRAQARREPLPSARGTLDARSASAGRRGSTAPRTCPVWERERLPRRATSTARPSWRSSARPPWCRRAGAASSTRTATCSGGARAARMIDPITLEVIREALVSTVREMRVTLVRTATRPSSTRARTSPAC